jgi:hypothetical protein
VHFLELLTQPKHTPVQFVVTLLLLLDGKFLFFILYSEIYFCSFRSNIVHGSDSEKAAKHEIDLWFKPEELLTYHRAGAQHLHDKYTKE